MMSFFEKKCNSECRCERCRDRAFEAKNKAKKALNLPTSETLSITDEFLANELKKRGLA